MELALQHCNDGAILMIIIGCLIDIGDLNFKLPENYFSLQLVLQ